MFKVTCAALLAALSSASSAWASCDDPFADPNEVLTFHLELTRADWNTVRTAPMVGEGCEAQYPMVHARFRCGETGEFLEIGVRRKRGDQYGQDTDEKPPIKLDINEFVDGQRWPKAQKDLGYRKLSLNTGQQSKKGGVLPALLSEHVAWRVMRAAVPTVAAGVAYARVFVQLTDEGVSEYHGVYILIEDLDKTAVRRRLGTTCGRLMKTTQVECPDEVDYDDGLPNESAPRFQGWLSGADTSIRADQAVALESLLTQEAVRDILGGGYDTPLGPHWNNFYQFEPRVGRVTIFPWDLDVPFRPFPEVVAPENQLEPRCSTLGQKTRCDSKTHVQYRQIACDLTLGPLAAKRLLEAWDAADNAVRPFVGDETELVWKGVSPLDESVKGSYAAEHKRIRAWIPARIDSVRKQLACPSACGEGATRSCGESLCATQRCTGGLWSVCAGTDPVTEVCDNGLDDDCDGSIDEGCKLTKEVCPKGEPNPVLVRPAPRCGCDGAPGLSILGALLTLVMRRGRRTVASLLRR